MDPTSHPLIARFRAARLIPVIRTSTAARAATAIAWLREAGLSIFEVTLTIPEAPALIRELAADPALLVGAGTVTSAAEAEACLAAGARFLVSPWLEASILPAARRGRRLHHARRRDARGGARGAAGRGRCHQDFPGQLLRRTGAYQGAARGVSAGGVLPDRRGGCRRIWRPTSRPGPPSWASAASWPMRPPSPPATAPR